MIFTPWDAFHPDCWKISSKWFFLRQSSVRLVFNRIFHYVKISFGVSLELSLFLRLKSREWSVIDKSRHLPPCTISDIDYGRCSRRFMKILDAIHSIKREWDYALSLRQYRWTFQDRYFTKYCSRLQLFGEICQGLWCVCYIIMTGEGVSSWWIIRHN